jgi:hypothetical protein
MCETGGRENVEFNGGAMSLLCWKKDALFSELYSIS